MIQHFEAAPIQPMYRQEHVNDAIQLGQIQVSFSTDGKNYQATMQARQRFIPRQRLEFTFSEEDITPEPNATFSFTGDKPIILHLAAEEVDCLCVHEQHSSECASTFTLSPSYKVIMLTQHTDAIVSCIFHLVNFPQFLQSPDDYILEKQQSEGISLRACGEAVLAYGNWRITIAEIEETDSLDSELLEKGGFAITHACKIARTDSVAFTTRQLTRELECLHYFISFIIGRWVGITLPVGLDESGKKVFEQWGLPWTASDHWVRTFSSFDRYHPELLTNVYPEFRAKWDDPAWERALRTIVYWYLAANERTTGIGVDAGLILGQTALEALAWTYCVEDRKMVSRKSFGIDGLEAADKLRLLATTLDLPLAIPDHMTALKRLGKEVEIPEAITRVRNALVHSKSISLPKGAYFEAWQVAQWYIELALLRVCRYNGQYGNRLRLGKWSGNVEMVPWVKLPNWIQEQSKNG